MDLDRHILAAQGYSELGMTSEALAELDTLHEEALHPGVLQTRLQILMRMRSWKKAAAVGKQLCAVAPDLVGGFLQTAFCMHELGKTSDARATLLAGPEEILKEPTYHYNLACYEAVLGNLREASEHLQRSIALNPEFKRLAEIDPDLKPLKDSKS